MKQKTIDDYHWHEVVDRTGLIMDLLGSALENHPVILDNPKLRNLLDNAHAALFELYQTAGLKHLAGHTEMWVVAVEEGGVMCVYGTPYKTRDEAERDAELPKQRGQRAEVWGCRRHE